MRLLRGEAKASFLMDHGRTGPPGILGGEAGGTNEIRVSQSDAVCEPEHLSKGEGYLLGANDWVQIRTPGGGGYGPVIERDPELIARDLQRGYFDPSGTTTNE